MDAAGNIYVADPQGPVGTVAKLDPQGHLLGTLLPGIDARSIASSIDGRTIFVSATSADKIYVIDTYDPVPAMTASSTTPLTGQTVTLDASGSTLPLGSITDYQWDLDGSGNYATDTGSSPTISTVFASLGPHNVGVRITGSTGGTTTATVELNVQPSSAAVSAVPLSRSQVRP